MLTFVCHFPLFSACQWAVSVAAVVLLLERMALTEDEAICVRSAIQLVGSMSAANAQSVAVDMYQHCTSHHRFSSHDCGQGDWCYHRQGHGHLGSPQRVTCHAYDCRQASPIPEKLPRHHVWHPETQLSWPFLSYHSWLQSGRLFQFVGSPSTLCIPVA